MSKVKGTALVIVGVILIAAGIYLGLIGFTTVEYRGYGPEGPGYYEVNTTYPLALLAFGITGLGMIVGGVRDLRTNRGVADVTVPEVHRPEPPSNRRCPSCGSSLESGWKVCPYCDYDINRRCKDCGAVQEPGWNVCPMCVNPPAQFCPRCGAKFKPGWQVCPMCADN